MRLAVLTASCTLMLGGLCGQGQTEPLPPMGVFEGVYHKDRFGSARFRFFVVPKQLQPRFAPYEGDRIRVEVKKGLQRSIPGPVTMQVVGAITRVQSGPDLQLSVARAQVDRTRVIAVQVRNRGKREITLDSYGMSVAGRSRSGKPLASGHPPRVRLHRHGSWTSALLSYNGYAMLGKVRLAPGQHCTLPFVQHTRGRELPEGAHEVEVTYRHPGEACCYQAWLAYDLPGSDPPKHQQSIAVSLRSVEVSPGRQKTGPAPEIYFLRLRLRPTTGSRTTLIRQLTEHGHTAVVRLRAWTRNNKEVRLREHFVYPGKRTLWNIHQSGATAMLAPLARDGISLDYVAVHQRAFPAGPIHSWSLDILTADGLERVLFGASFKDSLYVDPPPLGDAQKGIRMRVRPCPARRDDERGMRFVLQVVNERGTPLILIRPEVSEPQILVRVDGKEVPINWSRRGVYGWAAPHTCKTPREIHLHLPRDLSLKAGEHVIQVGLRGKGGTRANASGDKIPVLDGSLWTASTAFRVREGRGSR